MISFNLLYSTPFWHIKHAKAIYFKVWLLSYAAWTIPVQGEGNIVPVKPCLWYPLLQDMP